MRRRAAGNETHGSQATLLQRFLSEAQMPVMDGVEGAAQDAYWSLDHSLQGKAANIRQNL